MARWKCRGGKSQRRGEQKREDHRRERVRRKKMQVREKVGKSRNTALFQWFVAPEGWKVGLLKRRVRSHLARWEVKNCTPLWREAHFQVKKCNAHKRRSTFGSCHVEKVHAVVARSRFPSQNVQNTPCSEHFWKLRCQKSARHCGAKHISKSKCIKHHMLGPLLKVQMWFRVASAKWFCMLSKREGFVAFPKTMAGVGHLQRACKDAFRVAGAVQETCSSEMLGDQGVDFLRGCILEHQIFRFAKMIFAWQVQHFAWPGITFSWQAQYFRGMDRKNRKTHWHEAVSSALNFAFLKEVSRNCFVFAVVNFKNWGSLAELLRCWRCQVQKLGKSGRIASFSSLQIDR